MYEKYLELAGIDPLADREAMLQARHRLKLIDFWDIGEGSRVLEIGFGKGFCTTALAYAVGESGSVCSLEFASEAYGHPVSLEQLHSRIKAGPFADRISVKFDMDIAADLACFEPGYFDCAVISHSAWHLKSRMELDDILRILPRYTSRLCIAEWDSRIGSLSQLAHFKAAGIQSIYFSYHENEFSEIVTPFSYDEIIRSVSRAGWKIRRETQLRADSLPSGREAFEVAGALHPRIFGCDIMPVSVKYHLLRQCEAMRWAAENYGVESLGALALIAER